MNADIENIHSMLRNHIFGMIRLPRHDPKQNNNTYGAAENLEFRMRKSRIGHILSSTCHRFSIIRFFAK